MGNPALKRYRVNLQRGYFVDIAAEDAEKAAEYAAFYLRIPRAAAPVDKEHHFAIGDIELNRNDAVGVEELEDD